MKTLRIAKNELRALFYSPIAWFLLVVFLFDYGLVYTTAIARYKQAQDLGGPFLNFINRNITQGTFGSSSGLFGDVLNRIFLYLPLLTMGLMSRETSSGTIKLLYSSPVKVRQIVFGKFVAMMLFSFLLVAILGIFVGCGLNNIVNVDRGPLFSGLLGIFLMLCVYSAIGLFMSCLTTYQVVAAISTLVMLAFLNYVGKIWQDIDFVRDLTYFLSISGRAAHMMLGLITTKDILYFVLITGLFLTFSIYKLKGERETTPVLVKIGRYAGITVATVLLGYLFSRPGFVGYLDTTADKSQTLTPKGQEILANMKDGRLEVTSYINLLDQFYRNGKPEDRNTDMLRWESYLRFKPDIDFRYVYYYDSSSSKFIFTTGKTMKEIAEKYAKTFKTSLSRFKSPEEIHQEIDLGPEQNRYVMQLKYKGQSTFLRLYDDQFVFPFESETLAAMKRLTTSAPKIGFVTGDLERNIEQTGDRQYKVLTNEKAYRKSLVNQGFDVENISLHNQDIPGDITALVLADPMVRMDTVVLRKLEKYIADGGNLMIAGEPGRQEVLNPLLKGVGVQLMDGMLVQQSDQLSPDLVQGILTPAAADWSKSLKRDAADSQVLSMPGAVGLTYENNGPFDIRPLVVTNSKSSWSKKRKFNPNMIEKIEAPFAGKGIGAQLTAVGDLISGGGMGEQGKVDLKKSMANARVMSASSLKEEKLPDQITVDGKTISLGKHDSTATGAGKAGDIKATGGGTATLTVGSAPVHTLAPEKTGDAKAADGGQGPATTSLQPGMVKVQGSASFQKILDSLRALRKGQVGTAAGTTGAGTTGAGTAGAGTMGAGRLTTGGLSSGTPMTLSPAGGTLSTGAGNQKTLTDSAASGGVSTLSAANTGAPVVPKFSNGKLSVTSLAIPRKKGVGSFAVKPAVKSAAQPLAQPEADDSRPVDLAYSAADGDIRGTLPVALELTRKINGRQQRIVVVGDADFLSNSELNRKNVPACNFDFATSLFGWVSDGKFPVDVVRPEPKDNRVSVTDEGLNIMKILFLGVLPGLTLLLGALILIRRKRK